MALKEENEAAQNKNDEVGVSNTINSAGEEEMIAQNLERQCMLQDPEHQRLEQDPEQRRLQTKRKKQPWVYCYLCKKDILLSESELGEMGEGESRGRPYRCKDLPECRTTKWRKIMAEEAKHTNS